MNIIKSMEQLFGEFEVETKMTEKEYEYQFAKEFLGIETPCESSEDDEWSEDELIKEFLKEFEK